MLIVIWQNISNSVILFLSEVTVTSKTSTKYSAHA